MEISLSEFAKRAEVKPARIRYLWRHKLLPGRRVPEDSPRGVIVIDEELLPKAKVLLRVVRRGRPDRPRRMPKGALTAQDLATRMGVPRWKVYQLVKAGKLAPAGRVGPSFYFAEEASRE